VSETAPTFQTPKQIVFPDCTMPCPSPFEIRTGLSAVTVACT
jgi:hypothetical protein